MRVSVPIALMALCSLAACNADGDTRGSTAGSTGSSSTGGSTGSSVAAATCDSAEASADCCMVDADCKGKCPAGAFCRCAIRHDQPGHCYADCPLEKTQVTLGSACTDYFSGTGCVYGPDGKLDPDKGNCGYYCWRDGWYFVDCDVAATCARTGGTESSASCCYYAMDFPPTCPEVNLCGCNETFSTAKVKVCQCPAGMCFSREKGCLSPTAGDPPG